MALFEKGINIIFENKFQTCFELLKVSIIHFG